MAFIPTLDTVSVEVLGLWFNQVVEFNLNFSTEEEIDNASMTLLASNLFTEISSELLPLLTNKYSVTELRVKDMSASPGLEVVYGVTVGNVGGLTDESLPTQNALVVKFLTGISGRSYKGRIYVPGLTIQSVEDGSIVNTFAADMVDAINTIAHAGDADGWEHVVVSKYTSGAPRAAGLTVPVSSYSYNPQVGIQRKRRIGSGS